MGAIHVQAFPPGEAWDGPYIAGLMGMPGVFGFLSDAGGMAMARVAADEAELLTIAVLQEARGQGLGGQLLDAVLAEAARRGAARLLLEVSETNAPARALYTSRGARMVGGRRDYYAPGAHALILSLPVPQAG